MSLVTEWSSSIAVRYRLKVFQFGSGISDWGSDPGGRDVLLLFGGLLFSNNFLGYVNLGGFFGGTVCHF